MTRHKRKLLKMRRRREERKRQAPSHALWQVFAAAVIGIAEVGALRDPAITRAMRHEIRDAIEHGR